MAAAAVGPRTGKGEAGNEEQEVGFRVLVYMAAAAGGRGRSRTESTRSAGSNRSWVDSHKSILPRVRPLQG
jgi:hypothetical protein